MELLGIAPRSWVDKKTGELKERKVIWVQKTVDGLEGIAVDEVMILPKLLPEGTKLGDDILVIRDGSGFVQSIVNLTQMNNGR